MTDTSMKATLPQALHLIVRRLLSASLCTDSDNSEDLSVLIICICLHIDTTVKNLTENKRNNYAMSRFTSIQWPIKIRPKSIKIDIHQLVI